MDYWDGVVWLLCDCDWVIGVGVGLVFLFELWVWFGLVVVCEVGYVVFIVVGEYCLLVWLVGGWDDDEWDLFWWYWFVLCMGVVGVCVVYGCVYDGVVCWLLFGWGGGVWLVLWIFYWVCGVLLFVGGWWCGGGFFVVCWCGLWL